MADSTPSVAEYLQQQFGANIEDISPDGMFKITRQDSQGNWQEGSLDARAMLAADLTKRGIQTDSSKIPLTSPDAPVGDSKLPFLTQYNLAKSATPKDRYNYLVQELGKDNVKLNSNNELVVKTPDGLWSKGKTNSTLASVVSGEGGAIAGMVAGAQFGGGVGTAFGPLGTVAGAAIGSGLGAVIGKLASIRDAYKGGMRTEGDAADVAKELGKEFIFGLAGEALVGGATALTNPRLYTKAFQKISAATSDAVGGGLAGNNVREGVSTWVSQMSGVEQNSARFALDHPDMFGKYFPKASEFEKAGGTYIGEANPVFAEGAKNTVEELTIARKTMTEDMGTFLNIIKPVLRDVHVTPSEIQAAVNPDSMIRALQNSATRETTGILKNISRRLGAAAEEGGLRAADKAVPLEALTDTIKFIDEMVDRKIAPGMVMNDTYVRSLGAIRDDLKTFVTSKLDKKMVEVSYADADGLRKAMGAQEGKLMKMGVTDKEQMLQHMRESIFAGKPVTGKPYDVGQLYNFMNTQYKTRAEMFELLAGQTDKAKVESLYKKLTGPTGGAYRQDLANLLTHVGRDGEGFVKDLYARKVAVEMSPAFNPSRTASGPISAVANMLTGPLGTSPRMSGKYLQALGESSFMKVKAGANAADFVAKLTPTARKQLLQTPDALKSALSMSATAELKRQQMKASLVQEGIKKVRGQ